jgi:YD repeat-containing protein
MPGDPRSGSKVWKAADQEIGKPGENRGKVVVHRNFQPAAAFPDRENRCNVRSCQGTVDVQPIFSTKSDGNHTYTYDAENRIIQVDGGSTGTYTYDAAGRRVAPQTASAARTLKIRSSDYRPIKTLAPMFSTHQD